MRARLALLAGLTLLIGFAVASTTGNRPLGGVVLVAGGGACAWLMQRQTGWLRTLVVLAVALALFVLSHPLGKVIGPWPSVALVSIVAAAVTYALAGRDRQRSVRR